MRAIANRKQHRSSQIIALNRIFTKFGSLENKEDFIAKPTDSPDLHPCVCQACRRPQALSKTDIGRRTQWSATGAWSGAVCQTNWSITLLESFIKRKSLTKCLTNYCSLRFFEWCCLSVFQRKKIDNSLGIVTLKFCYSVTLKMIICRLVIE